jgi:hypothetical protein
MSQFQAAYMYIHGKRTAYAHKLGVRNGNGGRMDADLSRVVHLMQEYHVRFLHMAFNHCWTLDP